MDKSKIQLNTVLLKPGTQALDRLKVAIKLLQGAQWYGAMYKAG
jgi:hypothetical protein